ncbi:MAG TPA: type II toxin-antitoxin system VapC family toxin, partial [Terriglobales bacterium]
MIFIDSNIPMYLVGASHPNKTNAQLWLEKLTREHHRLVTSAEVLQEILHRYVAIHRRKAIQPAFDALTSWVDEVLAVDRAAV